MRKLALLMALVMAFAVAGMAAAAPVTINGDLFNDATHTDHDQAMLLKDSPTNAITGATGDVLTIDTTELDATGWGNLRAAIEDWAGKSANANKTFKLILSIDQETIPAGALKGIAVISDITTQADRIGAGAFENMKELAAVTLSGTVFTDVPDNFAKDSKNLSLLTISSPNNIKTIGNGAFSGTALTSFTVGANVKTIGASAFEKCEALTTLTLTSAAKLESIGANAFNGAKVLTGISFVGTKLKTIGDGAFKGCVALTGATFNNDLKTIGADAFSGCKAIAGALAFPGTGGKLETIGAGAFEGCAAITSLVFSNLETLTSIGDNAFKGAKALIGITDAFDDSVLTELGANIFEGTGLDSGDTIKVNFADTLAKIGSKAFGKMEVEVVFRYGTTEPEFTSAKELADFLAGLDMKGVFKGTTIDSISIADANYPSGVELADLGIVLINNATDPDTASIVESLYKAGVTPKDIVKLFDVTGHAPGSAVNPTYPLTLGVVDDIVKDIQDDVSGGDPGTPPPATPVDPGTPSDPGASDGGSSGCDVTGLAPLAALLALGLAKVRKHRG